MASQRHGTLKQIKGRLKHLSAPRGQIGEFFAGSFAFRKNTCALPLGKTTKPLLQFFLAGRAKKQGCNQPYFPANAFDGGKFTSSSVFPGLQGDENANSTSVTGLPVVHAC